MDLLYLNRLSTERKVPGCLDAVPTPGLVKGLTDRDWTQSADKTQSFVLLNLSSGGAFYSGSFW